MNKLWYKSASKTSFQTTFLWKRPLCTNSTINKALIESKTGRYLMKNYTKTSSIVVYTHFQLYQHPVFCLNTIKMLFMKISVSTSAINSTQYTQPVLINRTNNKKAHTTLYLSWSSSFRRTERKMYEHWIELSHKAFSVFYFNLYNFLKKDLSRLSVCRRQCCYYTTYIKSYTRTQSNPTNNQTKNGNTKMMTRTKTVYVHN